MSEAEARQLYSDAESYTQTLVGEGWIERSGVSSTGLASPSDLFAPGGDRPLIVGLFGGTGVGKSSLLNRLAGSAVAKTGVVRPTSMAITAYLHSDNQLARLPAGFPEDQFSKVQHGNDKYTDVMWVDMPDFDSEETQNREQVMSWLPYIDLLLYVVTPERYKDEEGWRLLLENGYAHAWLFILNQWDRAQDIQLNDFKTLLTKAGFETPRIFRTICLDEDSGVDHPENEVDQLADFVALLAERNSVAQLEQRGWLQRLERARLSLDNQIDLLEGGQQMTLTDSFAQHWARFIASVKVNLDLSLKEYSQQFAEQKNLPLLSTLSPIAGKSGSARSQLTTRIAAKNHVADLWDNWSETRLNDAVNQFELAEDEHGVPQSAVLKLRQDVLTKTSAQVKAQMELQLNEALQNPGAFWQRGTVKVLIWLQWLLPLLAIAWVGYRIVNGFVSGAADKTAYVGMDFLLNGMLLIGLAWLLPYAASRLLRPSIPKSVYTALHQAVSRGLEMGVAEYLARLSELGQQKESHAAALKKLRQRIVKVTDRSVVLNDPELKQLLLS